MKKVTVSSTNPVKINATKSAFEKMFPEEQFEFEGVKVESGVSDQPMTDEETRKGAINRAQNATVAFPDADYWVGLEGGIEVAYGEMRTFAWIAIVDTQGRLSTEKSVSHMLPPAIAKLVSEGKELGDADDQVFQRRNSKQTNGTIGYLTNDLVTRTSIYTDAVILALVPFRHQELYFTK